MKGKFCTWIVVAVPLSKLLHDPVDLLSLSRQAEVAQERPQRIVDFQTRKVFAVHVGMHHRDLKRQAKNQNRSKSAAGESRWRRFPLAYIFPLPPENLQSCKSRGNLSERASEAVAEWRG